MLNKLGGHTRYYSPEEFSRFNVASDGEQTGILLASVKSQILPSNIGYISIELFTKQTPNEVIEHLNNLTQEHHITNLILDLRNNLGGILDASVEVANLFLDKGVIYSSKGKSIDSNRKVKAENSALYKNMKILIIINQDSASSSEILAGALQDNKRAIILGENSYGKGTIQTVFSLRNGSAIKITTSEYFTPNGHKIQATGIIPDIKFNTEGLSNRLDIPIFDDLQMYQAYLQLVTKIKSSK